MYSLGQRQLLSALGLPAWQRPGAAAPQGVLQETGGLLWLGEAPEGLLADICRGLWPQQTRPIAQPISMVMPGCQWLASFGDLPWLREQGLSAIQLPSWAELTADPKLKRQVWQALAPHALVMS